MKWKTWKDAYGRFGRVTMGSGEMLHVEMPNGTVNIKAGLTDRYGREVDSILTVPDNCPGELPIVRSPMCAANVLLTRLKHRRQP